MKWDQGRDEILHLLTERDLQRVNPSRDHAVRAQLDPPLGQTLLPFDRMRRTRHEVEYPPADALNLTAQDVADDIVKSSLIVELVVCILDEMSPF
jgi:hypothetical protein